MVNTMMQDSTKHKRTSRTYRWMGAIVFLAWSVMACGVESTKTPVCFHSTDCGIQQSCVNTVCVAVVQGVLPPLPESSSDQDAGTPDFVPELPTEPPPSDPGCGPPTLEECNNTDDDCNGLIDDNLTRACRTPQSGECAAGTQTCANGIWGTCVAPKPAPETCDGKDNDCNGLIDDGITGQACYTGTIESKGKGVCQTGRNQCQNGKLQCVGQIVPSPELCGDNKDNNCNGKIDETCGEKQNLWVATQNSGGVLNRGFKDGFYSNLLGVNYYKLQPDGFSCEKDRVLLVSPLTKTTEEPLSTVYECSGEWFKIFFYAYKKNPVIHLPPLESTAKPDFHAVSPTTGSWGRVLCKSDSTCSVEFVNHPNPVIQFKTNGVFELKYTTQDYCQKPGEPVLATLYGAFKPGSISGRSLGNGVCQIQTYTIDGVPSSQSFVFWIPQANKDAAWATVSQQGQIVAANTFDDTINRWSLQFSSTQQKLSVPVLDANKPKASSSNLKILFLAAPQLQASSGASGLGLELPQTSSTNLQDVVVRTYKKNINAVEFSASPVDYFLLLFHAP